MGLIRLKLSDLEDDSKSDIFEWYFKVDCSDLSVCYPTALTAHESNDNFMYLGTIT